MKTVIVTGSSRGVGLAISKLLLKNNYKVVGISRSESQDIKNLRALYSESYFHLNFDLSETEKVKDLYRKQIKSIGPIYGFVNNAAIAYDDIITNLRIDPLEKMYKVNVFSPMMLTKYILRDMLLNKVAGNIIHISSISAHTGYKGLAMYASTKGALEAFSKNTAREWGELGIRSNIVCPGFMDTDMSRALSEDQKTRIFKRNSMKNQISINSVSETVSFLIGEGAASITGQVIHVDNGTI